MRILPPTCRHEAGTGFGRRVNLHRLPGRCQALDREDLAIKFRDMEAMAAIAAGHGSRRPGARAGRDLIAVAIGAAAPIERINEPAHRRGVGEADAAFEAVEAGLDAVKAQQLPGEISAQRGDQQFEPAGGRAVRSAISALSPSRRSLTRANCGRRKSSTCRRTHVKVSRFMRSSSVR